MDVRMLRSDVDLVRKLTGELHSIWVAHNRARMSNPVVGIEDDVLVGPAMDSEPYTFAPPTAVMANASLPSSGFVPDVLAEVRESQVVLGGADSAVRCLPVCGWQQCADGNVCGWQRVWSRR